jgi:hypothetical protein
MPAHRSKSAFCRLRVEELETRLTPAPVVLQPDLTLANIGTASNGPPAQMVFGPDGRLYVTLANSGNANAPSVESFAYNSNGALSGERVEASTGGAIGIGFGPVSLGVFGNSGVQTVTGMYLSDTARGNSVSNLRVLTQDQNGVWGGPAGGTNTIIVQNIPAGWHQTDQLMVKQNADGTSTLYVGIGVRTKDGASPYPNPGNARDMAYGGTISEILDMKQVNGIVTDSAGFGLTGDASTNNAPDYSNAGPYTSTAVNKLIIQSSGTRNPYGLALDGSGNLWFTSNFNRSQSDGTFNGTINPQTGLLYGIGTGDPAAGPDLKNNAYDQLFEAAPLADYGYNNSNWRNDAANDNPSVTSNAGVQAGFFNFAQHGERSVTFDNLLPPPGGFAEYDMSNINQIRGLGPSSSSDGIAFYTGNTFPATYDGNAFIVRWNPSISDSTGHSITYDDLVAVDPTTGNVRRIVDQLNNPLAVLQDGSGNLLVADYGDSIIYRLTSISPTAAITGPLDGFQGVAGQTRIYTVSASHPVPGTQAAGFKFTINWGDGVIQTTAAGTASPANVSHAYAQPGSYTITATATDEFGTTSAPVTSSVNILPFELQGTTLAIGGTTGNDEFVFGPAPAAGQWSVTVDGSSIGTFQPGSFQIYDNGGADTVTIDAPINGSALTIDPADVVVNGLKFSGDRVGAWFVNGVGANDTFTEDAGGQATITGGSGTNTLVGPNTLNNWQIGSLNAGNLNSAVFFSNIQNLVGGTGTDKFHLTVGASLSGTINGGGGSGDLLDYSFFGKAATVNLQTDAATGIAGFSKIANLLGAGTKTTLIGPNSGATWNIAKSNTGTVKGFWFGNVANLVGGASADTFKFTDGQGVTGSIDGGGGSNALDYSGYTTGVAVNLTSGSATGATGGVKNIEIVTGGSGNDTLTAGSGNDILLGGSGNDVLTGGAGRAILIGGLGTDQFTGGSGDDILIAGITSYDTNLTALEAILVEWARTDELYFQRVSHIHGWTTGGLNGSFFLRSNTVTVDSTGSDTLTGGSGMDWFWANVAMDTINNKKTGERVN